MANYQNVGNYTGSLYGDVRYQGIEYDWEVPDNLVIASPGGVSAVHHHWTKGLNGRGNLSGDMFAGQGERYIAGVYGNLYETGQEAGQQQGYYSAAPDYQYWQNQEPGSYAYEQTQASLWTPEIDAPHYNGQTSQTGGYPQKKAQIEAFNMGYAGENQPQGEWQKYDGGENSDFDLIESADEVAPGVAPPPQSIPPAQFQEFVSTSPMGDSGGPITESVLAVNPEVTIKSTVPAWLIFLFFLLAFIAFDFWAETGHAFVRERWHGGQELAWKQLAMYATIITVTFVLLIWLAGVPVATFEGL